MDNIYIGLLFLITITKLTQAFDVSIRKPDGQGTYYHFWFIYAVISMVMAAFLVLSAIVSMCKRYKLVANEEEEISESLTNLEFTLSQCPSPTE